MVTTRLRRGLVVVVGRVWNGELHIRISGTPGTQQACAFEARLVAAPGLRRARKPYRLVLRRGGVRALGLPGRGRQRDDRVRVDRHRELAVRSDRHVGCSDVPVHLAVCPRSAARNVDHLLGFSFGHAALADT